MPSEAQKRADRKYKRNKTRQLCVRFYPAEDELWTFVSQQKNKQGFLKELISREMGLEQDGGRTERDGGMGSVGKADAQ